VEGNKTFYYNNNTVESVARKTNRAQEANVT